MGKGCRDLLWLVLGFSVPMFAADPVPPLHLLAVRRATLQPPSALVAESTNRSEVTEFRIQTAKAREAPELYIQRHEAMKGRSPLRTPAPVSSSRFVRTLDALLPAKSTLFGKNPNARRDPLDVDGW